MKMMDGIQIKCFFFFSPQIMLLKHKIAEIQIKYDDQYHLWTAEILMYPHTWILVHDAKRDKNK